MVCVVFQDPVDLGWHPYVKTWLQRLPRDIPESGKQHLSALFDHAVDKGLKFTRQYAKFQMLPTPELSIIQCLCNILAAFFDFMVKNGGFGNPGQFVQLKLFELLPLGLMQNSKQ